MDYVLECFTEEAIDFSNLHDEDELVKKLIENKAVITTAESCTGGMISSTLINVSGASSVLKEAYVTYANEAKIKLLSVNKNTLDRYGVVSSETAYEMVNGVIKKTNSDAAIVVTGIAGPDGGTIDKPVGTVYAGLRYKEKIRIIRYNFTGDRLNVRTKTTKCVISDLYAMLE